MKKIGRSELFCNASRNLKCKMKAMMNYFFKRLSSSETKKACADQSIRSANTFEKLNSGEKTETFVKKRVNMRFRNLEKINTHYNTNKYKHR